ncbi:Glu/Leu/Phe/Val dehydrogenase dimerization domain-containing protein [Halomonas salifodinae]|uniref:Glu/Leu/Phe/Val dehydrogenase dimerization domain-containing protein n=1 Tax=Halomonas salifodinae TaxID=438745 RepID=A0ABW2EZY0_9GAMM
MADHPLRLLLVEDNPLHSRLIQQLLKEDAQLRCEVEAVSTLAEGLTRLVKGRIDLVLLDLVLPDSQELETLWRVRLVAPQVPVVILTGLDDLQLAARAVESGASDYLVKSNLKGAALGRTVRYTLARARVRGGEWDSPLFRQAQQQFLKAAQVMALDDGLRQRLLFPQRARLVTFPFRRDDHHQAETLFGYRVQHLLLPGPTLGGVRLHPELGLGEMAALAMWTSWQCALLGLPCGGAKGGVRVDPTALDPGERQRLLRAFARELREDLAAGRDILAPGLGVDEQAMAWLLDEGLPVTGKPALLGGLPRRQAAIGAGLVALIAAAAEHLGIALGGARVVLQGLGQVGLATARQLVVRGVRLIGVGDASAARQDPAGLDLAALEAHLASQGALAGFAGGEPLDNGDLLSLPCDILVLAAVQQQVTAENAPRVNCRLLAEGAHGPTLLEAEESLHEREVFVLPDILGNAAGAGLAYLEWAQGARPWERETAQAWLEARLLDAFRRCLGRVESEGLDMRTAALVEALLRLEGQGRLRGQLDESHD